MVEEIPLKLIELSDFLRSPSILSKNLQFKQIPNEQLNKTNENFDPSRCQNNQSDIILSKENELIVPKDVILFADDVDRKKIRLFNKSNNLFSRHLLITSGAALQSLIPSLTNAKEWIIISKLKFVKRYTKELPIHGTVVMSLNVNHPIVRYEILTAFEVLQQSFNEVKSAYIVIDFCQILNRWFKTYLRHTDQYPSLTKRVLYRYEIQTNKCSITLGKRNSFQDNNHHSQFGTTLQKIFHKSDIPMQIFIDFNYLPTNVYSIQFDNIFVYSMNDQYKQIMKDIGNGLSLVSVENLQRTTYSQNKDKSSREVVKKQEIIRDEPKQQQQQSIEDIQSSYPLSQATEQEKYLFDKIWDNQFRMQIQHQQLIAKAAKFLASSSIHNYTFNTNNALTYQPNQNDSQINHFTNY